jgi:hypothetical protein
MAGAGDEKVLLFPPVEIQFSPGERFWEYRGEDFHFTAAAQTRDARPEIVGPLSTGCPVLAGREQFNREESRGKRLEAYRRIAGRK